MDSIRFSSTRAAVACMAALLCASPAFALFKVVGPDGKVSFTDRPPADGKVQQVNPGRAAPLPADAALPYELRQAAQQHPVSLYTTTDCPSCDTARQLLKSRGIPYAEKSVTTAADVEALQRLSGGRELPVISIGTKLLRGLQPSEVTSYLDAAGYPKTSQLPPNYRQSAVSPLVPAPAAEPVAAPSPAPSTLPAAPPPAGFRF